ncbi:Vitamin B12 ABC transporter, permease protein BtuC [hydrothermal vent metagenome]|uniref:Vitamin B12 ABC transporter, permease protein BtuC n=1 Tax=hydrothermal vent metagenome TaxID=652676 RepID=A0A3B0REP7_9ZZZZ
MEESRSGYLPLAWVVAGLLALAAAGLFSILSGPIDLAATDVFRELMNQIPGVSVGSNLSELQSAILTQIRLPRVILGMIVGGTLAVAGGAYQGVFRNPLADPWLLGVAAGAGLGATLAISGVANLSAALLPLAAFIGALGAVALTYFVGYSLRAGRTATTLILAGVAVASFLTALQTYLQQRNSESLREVYSWILGGLQTASWREVRLVLPYVVVSVGIVLFHGRLLDVMSVGDEEASALGINVSRVRLTVVVFASLGTAAVVAVSGLIGFVGIIVPHTVRLIAGSSYRRLLVLSTLFGAVFLVLADVAARTIASPAELPLGVITAFAGAPFFAMILRRSKGGSL